ncbi:MAG: LacI family DNA-binding transcriptional regulator [Pleomorphochaeta sp.]
MGITRDLVAKEANVSSATVSRVFNNPNAVSPELRKKVLDVSKKLNYIPNKAASQLRRSGTGVIAVVKVEKSNRAYYWGSFKLFDWFYAQAQKGLLNAIENTSYQLSFYNIKNKKELIDISRRVDGVIGYDIDTKEEELLFEKLDIPCVLAHHIQPNNKMIHVSTNNIFGGELQGKFLLNKNVKNPLYISGYIDQVLSHTQRLMGIKNIYPNINILDFDFLNKLEIKKMINHILDIVKKENCDGIAFVNDLVLVKTISKLNLNIPIIGYDGAPYISLIEDVASIDFNISIIYEKSLLKLIELINGKKVLGEIVLPTLLI